MRATSHNGRFGSAKHNGRNFDLSKAGHIDQSKTGANFYYTWNRKGQRGGQSFEDCERAYYDQAFGDALAAQNERHIRSRHEERIKTMEDWLIGRNTRPEECIYQIGDKDSKIDPRKFKAAAGELLNWMRDWSSQHGQPFVVLDAAGHMDEASYHMQLRRVWQYKDAAGNWQIGQNKALEAAGVELPEPGQPTGKFNNRKITFDRLVREKWLEICEKYGYQIERIPNEQHTEHMSKEALIELNEKKAELDRAIQEAQEARDRFRGMMDASKGVAATSEAVRAVGRQLPGQGPNDLARRLGLG